MLCCPVCWLQVWVWRLHDAVCFSPQEETAENTSSYRCRQHTHICIHILCVCMLCMHAISFIKPWENMLPPLLNIDVLGGLKWVNKSWNTDNTTLKEIESMQTFAMCDVWMLPQREREREMQWIRERRCMITSVVAFQIEKELRKDNTRRCGHSTFIDSE